MKFIKNCEHYAQIALLVLVFGVLPVVTYALALAHLESERDSLVQEIGILRMEIAVQKMGMVTVGFTSASGTTTSPNL
ncbi:MAG: hypothetical protein HZA80_00570 [Candidatus Taylorbacteria bacterium]|nr:hypothetical protein [Candidatus Taylorbacteria bacterium]